MKKYGLTIFALCSALLAGCAGNTNTKPSSTAASDTSSTTTSHKVSPPTNSDKVLNVAVPRSILVKQNSQISQAALNECTLTTQYSDLLKQMAQEKGINVTLVDSPKPTKKGYYFQPTFVQIYSGGNAFIGHRKFTRIHGVLFKNGEKVSEANFGRGSGGGFMGNFKGSCSVLGRTVEANVQDAILWLHSPVNGATFGDIS